METPEHWVKTYGKCITCMNNDVKFHNTMCPPCTTKQIIRLERQVEELLYALNSPKFTEAKNDFTTK